ncbi:MAG: TonB-dependent receptor [Deltaproteobacteria bacterium]|nr:TonB-dependent receptor [Deltaproteobacteria bacterium]
MEETVREVTSNITVITAEDIAKMPGTLDLGTILQKYGFQTYDTGGSSALYIRGLGNSSMTGELDSQVLILLNGHRVGSPDLSYQFPVNLERIEIVRGPAALQYGPAVAGVVNIITKRGQEGAFKSNLQVGFGSSGYNDQSLSFSGGTNGLDVSFGAFQAHRDDLMVSGGDIWERNSYGSKLGFDIDTGYTFLDNHRIGVNFYYSKINDLNLPTAGYFADYGSHNNYQTVEQYLENTTFSYTGSTPDKVFNWLASYTIGEVDSFSYYYSGSSYPDPNSTYQAHVKMNEFKAQLTFDKDIIALTAGFDYLKYTYTTDPISIPTLMIWDVPADVTSKNTAFYLLAKARLINDRLILSAGGRWDTYVSSVKDNRRDKTNRNFSPSVGAAFMVTDFLKLRAHYAEGIRMPNPTYIVGVPGMYRPNPNLTFEKSKSFEIGFDLSYDYIDASLTYFTTDSVNKVVSKGPTPDYLYYYVNLRKKSTISGFESSFKFDVGKMLEQEFSLAPYLNLTWITTRKHHEQPDPNALPPQAPGILPYVPTFMANYGIDFDYPDIGTSARLNLTYIGKRYTRFWGGSNPAAASKVGWHNYGGNTVVDLGIKQRLWDTGGKGQFYAKAEVNNIFDEDYAYTMDYPMPGRNFYLAVGWEY